MMRHLDKAAVEEVREIMKRRHEHGLDITFDEVVFSYFNITRTDEMTDLFDLHETIVKENDE